MESRAERRKREQMNRGDGSGVRGLRNVDDDTDSNAENGLEDD
jgi:hypothetical protein